jgi:hypothetical protein
MSVQDKVVADILAERQKAVEANKGALDSVSTANDWIAFVTAYLGRAAEGVYRNEREGQTFRENMVKAGGLIVSALVAYDRAQNRAKLETAESPVTA